MLFLVVSSTSNHPVKTCRHQLKIVTCGYFHFTVFSFRIFLSVIGALDVIKNKDYGDKERGALRLGFFFLTAFPVNLL